LIGVQSNHGVEYFGGPVGLRIVPQQDQKNNENGPEIVLLISKCYFERSNEEFGNIWSKKELHLLI
jgi:hypothetical protein